MTRFSAQQPSSAHVKSSRMELWKALTDPDAAARLTPYLRRIEVDGDRWTWHLAKVPLLGAKIGTTFTEVMDFEEPSRIDFSHDQERTDEHTEVEGEYHLEEDGTGSRVSIEPRGDRRPAVPGDARPRSRARWRR